MATIEGDGGRPPTGLAAAGDAASCVPQVPSASQLSGEGPRATSMVQTESSELRPTTDDKQFDDEDLEKMKKYVQELEVKNAELKQKLEAAEAKLKGCNKYINPDPLIDAELMNCHDVFLCPDESGYEKLSEYLAHPQSKLTKVVKVPGRKIRQALKQLEKDLPICIPPAARSARDKPKEFRRMTPLAKYVILGIIEDIYRLHRHGISLNGKFTLENFYWTHLKKIKLAPVLKLVAIKRDRDEMINDYHQIHRVILEMLGSLPIPADLQSLLDLMNCADPIKNQHIIRGEGLFARTDEFEGEMKSAMDREHLHMSSVWNDYMHELSLMRKEESSSCGCSCRTGKPPAQKQKHLYVVLDDWEKGYGIYRVGEDEFVSDAEQLDRPRQAESPLVRIKAHHCACRRRSPEEKWSVTSMEHWLPFDSRPVRGYAVHPDGRTVFMSVEGYNPDLGSTFSYDLYRDRCCTYAFDTERLDWTYLGEWILPFQGQGHYDSELDAWVGICLYRKSEQVGGRVCCCDVPSAVEPRDTVPVSKLCVDVLFQPGEPHSGAKLVYMGDSKFCLVESRCRHDDDDQHRRRFFQDVRMTSFVLKYDKVGDLQTTRRRAYASIWFQSHKPIGHPAMDPVAFWM
ncbi:hypothetical protein PR202_ga19142 [Eleusine coracana subsp. coracana]|uniref:Uncharacterized protein n=1 Tax=Eleusine coracana subsp. coracana TaxID=191504 RepID=A0AAV5CUM3_ELECO|nr:hypothetical protein PR202_ga19142 [Eleusine coracana subsp. coracana]